MAEAYSEQLLLDYIEDELPPADRAKVEAWMAGDPRLAELVRQMSADRRLLRELPDPPTPAWIMDDVDLQIERQMLVEESHHDHAAVVVRKRHVLRRVLFSGAIAAMLGLVGYAVVSSLIGVNPTLPEVATHHGQTPPAPTPEPSPAPAPVPQPTPEPIPQPEPTPIPSPVPAPSDSPTVTDSTPSPAPSSHPQAADALPVPRGWIPFLPSPDDRPVVAVRPEPPEPPESPESPESPERPAVAEDKSEDDLLRFEGGTIRLAVVTTDVAATMQRIESLPQTIRDLAAAASRQSADPAVPAPPPPGVMLRSLRPSDEPGVPPLFAVEMPADQLPRMIESLDDPDTGQTVQVLEDGQPVTAERREQIIESIRNRKALTDVNAVPWPTLVPDYGAILRPQVPLKDAAPRPAVILIPLTITPRSP